MIGWAKRVLGIAPPPAPEKRTVAAGSLEGAFKKWTPRAETLAAEMRAANYRLIRRRCKEASLNQPLIRKAVYELNDSIVGESGIRVLWRHADQAVLERVRGLWREWTTSLDFSADGECDFEGMQGQVCDEVATVGEAFLQRRLRPRAASEPEKIPWAYQFVTPDRVVDDRLIKIQLTGNRNVVIRGIEYDTVGRAAAYYFYDPIYKQPYANFDYAEPERSFAKWRRVPADRVIHTYNRIDSGFRRGLPLIMTGIIYSWLLKQNDEAQLKKQTVASMFAAFIHDIGADLERPEGWTEELEDIGDQLHGGTVYKLDPGKTVSFPSNPSVREYEAFDRSITRKIAASIGISYEALSADYKQVNYSSARHSHQKYARIMNVIRKKVMIKKLVLPIVQDFVAYLDAMALADTSGLSWRFVSPKPIIIDPAKEVAPKTMEIRAGLKPWSDAVAESGQDPEEVLATYAEDKKAFQELDLKFDSDPDYIAQGGDKKGEGDGDDGDNETGRDGGEDRDDDE